MEWILLAVLAVTAVVAVTVGLNLVTWVMEHIVMVLCACLLVGGAAVLLSGGFISVDLGDMGGQFSLDSGDLPDTGDLDLSGLIPDSSL